LPSWNGELHSSFFGLATPTIGFTVAAYNLVRVVKFVVHPQCEQCTSLGRNFLFALKTGNVLSQSDRCELHPLANLFHYRKTRYISNGAPFFLPDFSYAFNQGKYEISTPLKRSDCGEYG
jgi:hypothetical protein